MPALLIFDCDGVLIDSEVIYARVGSRTLTDAGIPISEEEIIARFTGVAGPALFAELQAEHGVTLSEDFYARQRVELDRAFVEDLKAVDGAAALLARLERPKCVASSTGTARLTRCLEATGLARYFDGKIYSAALVEHGKPAPDLFLYAAQQMGAEPATCLVLEDSVTGVQGAVAAGMAVVGFTGASHFPPGHDGALKAAGAGAIINHLDQFDQEIAAFAASA